MNNLRMQQKLTNCECIDVASIGQLVEDGDMGCVYKLKEYIDGKDYCIKESETWIWSIGKHKVTGEIFASIDTRYYQNPDYECLWLR